MSIVQGRFKGHPIHGMFVHFPIGLFSAGYCFDLLSLWANALHLPLVAFYCFAAGAGSGTAAMIFGLIDYMNLATYNRLFKKAGKHALLQLTAFLLFAIALIIKLPEFPDIQAPSIGILILEAVGIAVMARGNFIGGDLVYKDGVGTNRFS